MDSEKMKTSGGSVILFPEGEKLKKEVERLRTELSILACERDNLLLNECKNIEMNYMLTLGNLEYKAYEAECKYLRLKRKLELLQMAKNRQERISISQVEMTLDAEFKDYQKKLEEELGKINEALHRSKCEALSEKETLELKQLYIIIVKALHPDINPDLGEAKKELFFNAVDAYEAGDLMELRFIAELISDAEPVNHKDDMMTHLIGEKERLEKLIENMHNLIDEIKSKYPYTLNEILEDNAKIAERHQALDKMTEEYDEASASYELRIKELITAQKLS